MNRILKPKSLASIILSIVILFPVISLNATTPMPTPVQSPITPSEHIEIVQQFISEIRGIQNQVFDIAQFSLNNPPLFKKRLVANISSLNNRIDSLNTRILEYLKTIPPIGEQNLHALLTLNALNFVKNSLFSLSVLTNTSDNILRISLLDQYFRSRIAAIDTLSTVENLILQYNP